MGFPGGLMGHLSKAYLFNQFLEHLQLECTWKMSSGIWCLHGFACAIAAKFNTEQATQLAKIIMAHLQYLHICT